MKMLLILIMVSSVSVWAGSGDKSSGCGLGWQVTKSISWLGSSTRVTTNATFSSTIAMTTGTSGCAGHTIVYRKSMPIHYAEVNYLGLMRDMARGEGDYVDGFAKTFGCDNQGIASFRKTGKKHYAELFADGHSHGLIDRLNSHLKQDQDLSSSCTNIL
jgi:hypothetical protein